MPETYVGGRWTSARAGQRREIRCPADGHLVAEVDECGPEDTAAAIAAAREAFDDGRWSEVPTSQRGRPPAEGRRPPRARQGRRGPGRVVRHRQAPRRERVRRRRRRQRLPPLRPRRRGGGRPGRRHRPGRRTVADRARAARGLRADHAVELPAAADLLEGRALPRRRQHLRAQAERAHPAHRDPAHAHARRGRPARRGREPRPRRRREAGRSARRGPAGRPGLLHRRPRDRQAHHGGRLGDGEEGRPRARRQEPQHRLRRRRPRDRRSTTRSPRCSCTPARSARPAPASSSRSRSTTSSSTSSSSAPQRIRLGGPFDDKAETGPLISAQHRDKVEAYVARAVEQGATLRCGGARPDDPALADGFYYLPTILDGCRDRDGRRAERVVRSGAHRRDVHRRGRRGADRQRQHLRAGRRGVDRQRRQGRARRRAGCAWAPSGSTTTTPTCRRPSGAATSSPASAASSGRSGLEEYRETKHVWHNTRPAPHALVRRLTATERQDGGRWPEQAPARRTTS